MKNTYVVTIPENGWDCVNKVFKAFSVQNVKNYYIEEGYDEDYIENTLIIHQKYEIIELD